MVTYIYTQRNLKWNMISDLTLLTAARRSTITELQVLDPSLFVWIDETGYDCRNSMRKFGCGIKGKPPKDHSLKSRRKQFSAIGILCTNGIDTVQV